MSRFIVFAFFVAVVCSGSTVALAKGASCSGQIANVTAVSLDRRAILKHNYSGDRKFHDILATNIKATAKTTCIVVHVSAYIQPTDNHMVFQVTLDGVPMAGHAPTFPGTTINVPEISSPVHNLPRWVRATAPPLDPKPAGYPARESYQDVPRTVSYTFFQTVKGKKSVTIKLRATGCCSPTNGGANSIVHGATLVVQY